MLTLILVNRRLTKKSKSAESLFKKKKKSVLLFHLLMFHSFHKSKMKTYMLVLF